MFGIGGWEFLLIASIALLLFGPDKLPQFARTIGRVLRDFKRYQDLMESTFRAEMYSIDNPLASDTFKKGKEFRERVEAGEFERSDGTEGDEADGEPGDAHGTAEADDAASANNGPIDRPVAEEPPVRAGLPADHPLHDALESGADIGIDDDLDLASLDASDLGWVPGRDTSGEEGEDKA